MREYFLKWLRPATNQFRIYWDNNSKRYEPDFIAKTENTIYMIETKAANEMQDGDVLAKKAAAEKYCKYATEYTLSNGGKSWKYLLIPHNQVSRTVGLDYLITDQSTNISRIVSFIS
jgi:type III restriction enzyme